MKILKVNAKGDIDERRLLPENPNIGDLYHVGYWDYPESMREYLKVHLLIILPMG